MSILAPFMALCAALGVPEKARRAVAVFMGLITVAALCGVLWALIAHAIDKHDDDVRQADRDATSVRVLNAAGSADRSAGAAQRDRDAAVSNEQRNLEDRADDALANRNSPVDGFFNSVRGH